MDVTGLGTTQHRVLEVLHDTGEVTTTHLEQTLGKRPHQALHRLAERGLAQQVDRSTWKLSDVGADAAETMFDEGGRDLAAIQRVQRRLADAEKAVADSREELRRLVARAVDHGVPAADVADVLGVSRQYVYKLVRP